MMPKKIILASTSPRRRELAEQMGLDFEVVPSNFEEDMSLDLPPADLVMNLAYGKAKEVADRVKEGIILGVDTFIVLGGKKIGKPKSEEDAFQMLKSFSGRSVQVYSGVALIDCETRQELKDFEVSEVEFCEIDDREISAYIKTGEPLGRAGAFTIQGLGSIFIKSIKGCHNSIIGLPVANVYKNLKKFGVDVLESESWKKGIV